MEQNEMNAFTEAAMTAVLVNNDFHWMHLNSVGKDFDKSHNLAQDFYERIDEEVDYLMELAMEVGAPIFNYSQAGQIVPEYVSETMSDYDYQTLIEHLQSKVQLYLIVLRKLRDTTDNSSIQSRLDDMIRDWEKELYYKLTRRIEPSLSSTFVNTGLDNRVIDLLVKE